MPKQMIQKPADLFWILFLTCMGFVHYGLAQLSTAFVRFDCGVGNGMGMMNCMFEETRIMLQNIFILTLVSLATCFISLLISKETRYKIRAWMVVIYFFITTTISLLVYRSFLS